jgi:cobalt/nickel transport protein
MKTRMKRLLVCFFSVLWLPGSAHAHFNMLLPDRPAVKRGETAMLLYQWGHPFEHQLFDAPAPQAVRVIGPHGQKTDLLQNLEKIEQPVGEGKTVVAYHCRFTPKLRGDYLFVLHTLPIWMEEDQEFLEDLVKVVLHVQVQKGWDRIAGEHFELVPLTRPYGLEPGTVFQIQALADGKPLSGSHIEVEHYHPAPPPELPPDEQITRIVKSDPSGVATCTLAEPGWWCLTAHRDHGQREHNGKSYPVRQRVTFWVFVDERPANRSAR